MTTTSKFRVTGTAENEIVKLRAEGLTIAQIAARVKIGRSTVGEVLLRRAFEAEQAVPRQTVKARCSDVPDVIRRPAENDNRAPVAVHPIMETGGKWSALAAYAAERGLTTARAQQLWHKARAGQLGVSA